MAARLVKSWRGVLRGDIRAAVNKLTSLLNQNGKLLGKGVIFLNPAQTIDLANALADLRALLLQTKPR